MRHVVDAKRLLCPMPVIKLQNQVMSAKSGDTVEIHCTDPGVLHDIPAWCRINKHTITRQEELTDYILIEVTVS